MIGLILVFVVNSRWVGERDKLQEKVRPTMTERTNVMSNDDVDVRIGTKHARSQHMMCREKIKHTKSMHSGSNGHNSSH